MCSLPVVWPEAKLWWRYEDNGDLLQRSCVHTEALGASDPALGHCHPTPPQETPGHSRASLGQPPGGCHCSFLLSPGAHKVLFVPSKSLFSQSYVSSGGSMVGLMVTFSLMPYPSLWYPEPLPLSAHCWPVPPQEMLKHSKAGLAQFLWGLLVYTKILFESLEHLWWVWGLILNTILPLLPSCWGFSFALGHEVSFIEFNIYLDLTFKLNFVKILFSY